MADTPLAAKIAPERIYVESVPVGGGGLDRFILHLVVSAGDTSHVRVERVRVDLKGQKGACIAHVFADEILADKIRDAQSKIHGARSVAATPELAPREVAGVLDLYFAVDSSFCLREVEVDVVGRIDGEREVRAHANAPLLRHDSRHAFRLPFDGAWWVESGHERVTDTPHRMELSQQFAYDFVKVGEGGVSHRAEGTANEDYYAYGEPILAAADGTVVSAVDEIPDNRPGMMPSLEDLAGEPKLGPGNCVVLDHGEGEFAFYAHLVPGSVAVQSDEDVAQGQVLGRCGNSGCSTEPHLHFHLMDGPQPYRCIGLPIVFHNYERISSGDSNRPMLVERGILQPRQFVASRG